MENSTKMDDFWGYHHFRKNTFIYSNFQEPRNRLSVANGVFQMLSSETSITSQTSFSTQTHAIFSVEHKDCEVCDGVMLGHFVEKGGPPFSSSILSQAPSPIQPRHQPFNS